MKFNLTLLLAALTVVALSACHRKSANNTQAPAVTEKPGRPAAEPKEEAWQVAGFQKTACFGRCPVYQVKFFSDGKVTWYGQMNVERKGWHEARVQPEVLKSIRDKAHAVKFWDFYNEYPQGKKVADLPGTITYVRAGDMEKQIIDTHQAPDALKEFEKFMEELINSLTWRATEGK
ncbi:MAG: hypothetical protein HY842_09765 [Bacteroidetes bacterium]|nr:hypothetical protein [Bacteroidota bacterium]